MGRQLGVLVMKILGHLRDEGCENMSVRRVGKKKPIRVLKSTEKSVIKEG